MGEESCTAPLMSKWRLSRSKAAPGIVSLPWVREMLSAVMMFCPLLG